MDMVELSLHLFGKPAWELDDFEGKELGEDFSEKLRSLGDELKERLYNVAKIHGVLLKNGWTAYGGLYDITYYKDIPLEEAKKELKELGLEDYIENLMEDLEEEEEAEEIEKKE